MMMPTTAGMTRNGTNAATATSGNSGPPEYTMPYAVKMGSDEQRHHPRRVDHRFRELGQIEPGTADRGRDQEVEILGQEVSREGGDDVGEQQDREQRQQDHAEDLGGEQIADVLHPLDVAQHPEGDAEDGGPEGAADHGEHQQLAPGAAPLLLQARERPAPLRREQGPDGRLGRCGRHLSVRARRRAAARAGRPSA